MKNLSLNTFIVAFITLAIFTSCEDKTDKEDVIKNQQLIDLTIRIIDASNADEPLDSAIVEIVDKGEVKSVITDKNGLAIFTGVSITENIPVTATKTNYTKMNTSFDLIPDDFRQAHYAKTLSLFALTGENMATIIGRLTIETDVTNRERETVQEGLEIRAYNHTINSDVYFSGTTTADGSYEIKVPVSTQGNDDIIIEYPEVYANQTVAIRNEDYTIEINERPTYYNLEFNAENNYIPSVPSVYAVVDAPPTSSIGSGFSLESQVVPTSLSTYSQLLLINGGSGYTDGLDQLMVLSEGINGLSAEVQVDVENGSIIRVDGFVNNGALYTSVPTLNTSQLGGSGAVIDILFECSYNIYIANNGNDYIQYPEVYWTYSYYYNNIQLTEVTNSFNLSNYTDIVGGRIVNDNRSDVDTINITTGIVGAPKFHINHRASEQIIIYFNSWHIGGSNEYYTERAAPSEGSIGQIHGYNVRNSGYGYNRAEPPTVTLHSLNEQGSGATMNINLNQNGQLSSAVITNGGSGYLSNINDFRDNGSTSSEEEDPSFSSGYNYNSFRRIYNVKPGQIIIRDAHYGTGNRVTGNVEPR